MNTILRIMEIAASLIGSAVKIVEILQRTKNKRVYEKFSVNSYNGSSMIK